MNLKEFITAYEPKFKNRFDGIIKLKGTIGSPSGGYVLDYTAALEDWYYRLGSNLRDLGDELEGLESSGDEREDFEQGMYQVFHLYCAKIIILILVIAPNRDHQSFLV